MECERVVLRLHAAPRALIVPRPSVPPPVLLSVERELAEPRDFDGLGVDPPVDEIEVVPGLVHHETAGVGLLAVPSTEVVRPVHGVEQPFEVHGEDWEKGVIVS